MKFFFGDMNDRLFLPTNGHPLHYSLNGPTKGNESPDDIMASWQKGPACYSCFGEKNRLEGGQPKEEEIKRLVLLNSGYQNEADG
jgi:hypothetical protein